MRSIDRVDTGERLISIEQMIEHYRLVKNRRLERLALTLWRKIEAQQVLVELEKPLEPVH